MDPVRVLTQRRGAARLETLMDAGVTRGALARAVRDGRVVRPLYGCYALPGTARAVILRASYRADLACYSLCEVLGLPIIDHSEKVHLWVPRDRARRANDRRPIDGVVLHRHDYGPAARAGRVVAGLDLLGLCATPLQQIVAIDAALHRGLMREEQIDRFVHTAPAQRDWLRARCDRKAESLLETITRVTFADAGLEVRSQVYIPGVPGRTDLLVEGQVVVETDGKEYHNDSVAWARDIAKNNACIAAGFPPLHFTYSDVMGNRARMVTQVRALLR